MKKFQVAPAYSPSWKRLYSLIQTFLREEPWQLIESEDVFIVQSPRDHQMYLCSVMGNAGEEFGLNAFRGAQGMRNFYKMIEADPDVSPDRNFLYDLDMLSFSLSPRDYMEKNDLKVTKHLMLSFPGGKWPLIRSFRPHYQPWFLTEPEIDALCDCLEQTLELYKDGEDALDELRDVAPGEILVRARDGSSWESHHVKVVYPNKEETPEIKLDDITARRLLELPLTGPKEEIDLVSMPGPIKDHEPPYFGLLLMGVNEQHYAKQYGLFPPFEDYYQKVIDALVEEFLSRGSKPSMVLLRDDSPFADVFEYVADQAGFVCERMDELPYISDFLDSVDQAMENGDLPPTE